MISRFHHLAALWVVGNLVLALVTWACFELGLNFATTGFGFLIVIILLSLFDSFVSSVFFSIIAVGCLDYFFMEPLFSFTVASIEDITALAAFLVTSITITGLVRRSRRLGLALMDVTAARQVDEELHKVQAELAHVIRLTTLGELAASLAHEISQPIAAARNDACTALNFLDKQPPDLGEVKKQLGFVVRAADRSGEIIERIRDQIKKAPPRKDHFDLNKAIDEVLVLARSAITKYGVSVQTRLAEGTAPVEGDRVQLQQVALNLVLNAVEAMGSVEEGPRELLISIEQSQVNGVLVAVRDSGPGIDPKRLDRIFEAFYTTKSNGVGMGLSICRSIINAHGGRLWAEANEPRGAVFFVHFAGAVLMPASLRRSTSPVRQP
jgi:C4-dicarboxylate-specific signal transduction histidine kinase